MDQAGHPLRSDRRLQSRLWEADDALIAGETLFVDSRETTLGHIEELDIPIARNVMTADNVWADFYDLVSGTAPGQTSESEITAFKNGGGAHLALIIARYLSGLAGA
ncbi:hypothetical protein [Meridianimarinicoccus zhengii]|uniref:hypothetical protein n=1 Tax=Meridianimarinicoccus zhengii TaxID=2056810 RepID=UPI000DAE375F|nr:hypothetical protein [Phycocomes zhengii]